VAEQAGFPTEVQADHFSMLVVGRLYMPAAEVTIQYKLHYNAAYILS
jgi:hypothetical protein